MDEKEKPVKRRLCPHLFLLALLMLALPALAQSQRSYAPEDLGRLSISEQVDIIEGEYREQTGGRVISDEQLDYYLDRIRNSQWGLHDIQADIARSSGGWRPPGSGWTQRSVICSSTDRQYRECRTSFQGPARLDQQISSTRCLEGRNWGSRPGLVWVDEGCRGRFMEDPRGWGDWGQASGQREIVCESLDERYRQCNSGFRGRARLSRQLSDAACIEGRSWGQGQGYVWVSRGCRARFEDTGWSERPTGYSLICSSGSKGQLRTCPWNPRYGRPELVENLSQTRCVEGRNWGYRNNAIWVSNYCRGRFAEERRVDNGYSVTCASDHGDYRTCAWNERYGRPRLLEQHSQTACTEGRTWGYRNGQVWVDRGCRGRFGTY